MSESYCGRDCESCTYKEELKCSGCKSGPGRVLNGECRLAMCCREKGHEVCDTCSHKSGCILISDRDSRPRQRIEELAKEKEAEAVFMQRAPFLGKWLWVLFWIAIVTGFSRILTRDIVMDIMPLLSVVGTVLLVVSLIVYSVVLLVLSSDSKDYRKAGWCGIISTVSSIVYTFGLTESMAFIIAITYLLAFVLTIVGTYYEYNGHAELVETFDVSLADSWRNLWKIYIGIFVGVIVVLIATRISWILGVIALIIMIIAVIAVNILKFVYLYRTAQLFK